MQQAKAAVAPVRDAEATKARILDAAQNVFAARGYSQATVRDIAAEAGVAASLVLRYFSSKEALFERAFRASLNLIPMLSLPRREFGTGMVGLLNLENSDAVRSSAMLALSIGDPQSRAVVIRLMEEAFVEPVAEWIGSPDAAPRAQLVAMLTLGFSTLRNLLPLESHGRDAQFVTDFLADVLQRLVDMPERPNRADSVKNRNSTDSIGISRRRA
jgi:AcrR family transcriptional regulator